MSLSRLAKLLVQGANDVGVAPAGFPLDIAWDGALTRRLLTSTTGVLQVATAAGGVATQVEGTIADGVAAGTQNPVTASGVDVGGLVQRLFVDTSGRLLISGGAAGGAASVNPVVIGVSDGSLTQYVREAENAITAGVGVLASGMMGIAGGAGAAWNGITVASALADGAAGGTLLDVDARMFNGSSYDRMRLNSDNNLLASASRTTTQTNSFTVYNQSFLRVVLDMTDVTAGPSVTVTIDGQDVASGKWVNLLTGLPITTVSTNVYKVGVGLTPAANAVVNDFLVRTMRIVVTANNANAGTYSLGSVLTVAN